MSSQAEPCDHVGNPLSWTWYVTFLYGPIQSQESSLPLKSFNEATDQMSSHLSDIRKHISIHLFKNFPKYLILLCYWSLVHYFQRCMRASGERPEVCRGQFIGNGDLCCCGMGARGRTGMFTVRERCMQFRKPELGQCYQEGRAQGGENGPWI